MIYINFQYIAKMILKKKKKRIFQMVFDYKFLFICGYNNHHSETNSQNNPQNYPYRILLPEHFSLQKRGFVFKLGCHVV